MGWWLGGSGLLGWWVEAGKGGGLMASGARKSAPALTHFDLPAYWRARLSSDKSNASIDWSLWFV
jgi:hypothetical protein